MNWLAKFWHEFKQASGRGEYGHCRCCGRPLGVDGEEPNGVGHVDLGEGFCMRCMSEILTK